MTYSQMHIQPWVGLSPKAHSWDDSWKVSELGSRGVTGQPGPLSVTTGSGGGAWVELPPGSEGHSGHYPPNSLHGSQLESTHACVVRWGVQGCLGDSPQVLGTGVGGFG